MIYDKRYEDNIVLKRDAFQNLLTQIKNYPIIDIDYVSNENKKDVLHDNKIWHAYTDDTPCLKITYGDDRSLKGNIIFAEALQEEIAQKKEELKNKKIELHNAEYISAKVVKAFAQNKEIQEDKELEAQRIKSIWDKIANSKEQFLKAGLSILNFPFSDTYTTIDSLGPIDTFETLKPGTQYNANVTYYYLNDEKRYVVYTGGNTDWDNKVSRGEIYVYDGVSYGNLSPLTLSKISLYYTDVILNSFEKVASGEQYDENKVYYYLENDQYYQYIHTTQENWNQLRNNGQLYVSVVGVNKEKELSFTYTNLKVEDRVRLYTELINLKNSTIKQNNTLVNIFSVEEQEFIENFADFIIAYNYLTFIEELAKRGFSQDQIDIIRNLQSTEEWVYLSQIGLDESNVSLDESNQENGYSTPINVQGLRAIIRKIIRDESGLWKWGENSAPNFESMKTTFYDGFENIIGTIGNPDNGIIAKNLERLKNDYSSIQTTIHNLNTEIEAIKQAIADAEAEILNQAGANVIYGYKYVKLGNNIKWSDNFDYNVDDNEENHTFFIKTMTANDNAIQPTAPKEDQKSGTFRTQINGKLYEIPIKGFDKQSNQPINMSTSSTIGIISDSTIGITSRGNTTITAKDGTTFQTITLDGNVAINGTFNPNGNIINHMTPDPNATYNLGSKNNEWNILYARAAIFGNEEAGASNVRPFADETGNLGTKSYRWNFVHAVNLGDNEKYIDHAYIMGYNTIEEGNKGSPANSYVSADKGYFNTLYINGNEISADPLYEVTNGGTTAQFWRGGDTKDGKPGWSNTLTGNFIVDGVVTINSTNGTVDGNIPTIDSSLYSQGGAYFTKNVYGARVFNAVFNDYAEYRTTIDLEPGRVVIDNDDGSLSCSSKRLQPGAQVISDTFGHSMGYTENCHTPLAVAGRVLAYTCQDRNKYHAGMAVCSAPNGTVDIMTREEIKEYPDCIIGIVSEIPQYEVWGTDKVKVNNRIWIKIK